MFEKTTYFNLELDYITNKKLSKKIVFYELKINKMQMQKITIEFSYFLY